MKFSTELNQAWQPPRLVIPARAQLERVAQALAQRYGGMEQELQPPRDYLDEAERYLVRECNLSRLTRRHRKALPWILWNTQYRWSERPALVEAYLAWADTEWRTAPKHLWRHHLFNLDPDSFATQKLALWLQERSARLPERVQLFSAQRQLFTPNVAIAKAAQSVMEGTALLAALEALNLERHEVLRSGFMLRVLLSVGQQLRAGLRPQTDVAMTLHNLLEPLGKRPTYEMQVQALRKPAETALVEGIVHWTEQGGHKDSSREFVLFLIGDPRLYPSRWEGINPKVKQTVERWLTEITLDATFKVMLEFQTDRPDMVRAREQFWRGYQHAISRAWLVVASRGVPTAKRLLGQSVGRFSKGPMLQPDHCGLLLQLGDLVVFEMNKNGGTLFWNINDSGVPKFYETENGYSRDRMRFGSTALTHIRGAWQQTYAAEISRRTGIQSKLNTR